MTESGARTASRDLGRALVDAAERVLVREGRAGVTVRAVATEAGVAPMGVYNRFGSKDGLVAAVLVRGFSGLTRALADLDPVPAEGRLLACGRAYRSFALANPQHYAAMFSDALTAPGRTPEQDEELSRHAGAAFDQLLGEVRRSMDTGVLARADALDVAQVVWSAVHGAVGLELAGVQRVDDPAAAFERLLAALHAGLR